MGTRERYEPGTFSWMDLATPDREAAKRFYTALFGWSYDDAEMPGDGGIYSMAHLEGGTVGAIMQADPPARWNSYVTVADVEESATKARELEATVHAGPMDVGDAGRMVVLQDPTGGVLSLWEPKDNPGAGVVNAHGALAWNDLMTYDVGAAAEFYCELLGWEVAEVDMSGRPVADEDEDDDADADEEDSDADDDDDANDDDDDANDDDGDDEESETTGDAGQRVVIRNGERLNGGMATIPEDAGDRVPPHWLPYFGVESIEAALTIVRDEGGEVMAEPIDVPTGKIAVVADPQGAVFALFAGDLED